MCIYYFKIQKYVWICWKIYCVPESSSVNESIFSLPVTVFFYVFLQLFVTCNFLSVMVLKVFHIFDRNIKKQVKNPTLQDLMISLIPFANTALLCYTVKVSAVLMPYFSNYDNLFSEHLLKCSQATLNCWSCISKSFLPSRFFLVNSFLAL